MKSILVDKGIPPIGEKGSIDIRLGNTKRKTLFVCVKRKGRSPRHRSSRGKGLSRKEGKVVTTRAKSTTANRKEGKGKGDAGCPRGLLGGKRDRRSNRGGEKKKWPEKTAPGRRTKK